MKFYLNINMSGAAFEDQPAIEIEMMLDDVREHMNDLNDKGSLEIGSYPLRDSNGNTCGTYGFCNEVNNANS